MKEKITIELNELPEDPSLIPCRGIDFVQYVCPTCGHLTKKAKRYIIWNGYDCHSCGHHKSTDYEQIIEKRKKTWIEKYGVDNPSKTLEGRKSCSEAGKKSNRLHPLNETYQKHLNECLEKRKKTWTDKYGVDNPSKSAILRSHNYKRYNYDGLKFDSSWELAFYVYYKDKGCDVVREPTVISYVDNEGKDHKYFPDFSVDGQLFEIKGDHLLEKFKSSGKYDIACKNNVKILLGDDIKPFIEYVNNVYGEDFIKSAIKR